MKKLISTISFVALIALVPSVLFGYLHINTNGTENKPATEIAKDVTNGQDDGSILHIVKVF